MGFLEDAERWAKPPRLTSTQIKRKILRDYKWQRAIQKRAEMTLDQLQAEEARLEAEKAAKIAELRRAA